MKIVFFVVFGFLLFSCGVTSNNFKKTDLKGVYVIRVKGFWFCKIKLKNNGTYKIKSESFNCKMLSQNEKRINKNTFVFDTVNNFVILTKKNNYLDTLVYKNFDSLKTLDSNRSLHRAKFFERISFIFVRKDYF